MNEELSTWRLTQLDLSHNQLSIVTSNVFQNLTKLAFISFQGNQLYYIDPNIFFFLPSLTGFNLNFNYLSEVIFTDVNAFDNLLL